MGSIRHLLPVPAPLQAAESGDSPEHVPRAIPRNLAVDDESIVCCQAEIVPGVSAARFGDDAARGSATFGIKGVLLCNRPESPSQDYLDALLGKLLLEAVEPA